MHAVKRWNRLQPFPEIVLKGVQQQLAPPLLNIAHFADVVRQVAPGDESGDSGLNRRRAMPVQAVFRSYQMTAPRRRMDIVTPSGN
jgi:hypothetical protein